MMGDSLRTEHEATTHLPAYFDKPRMRQPDKNSSVNELSVSRAPKLRCVNSLVKSCMTCEGCTLGAKVYLTKEWFSRCGDPMKRKFILGLIHRFHSLDLFSYMSSILQPLQYKDFTYTRSRSKPSLAMDVSSPPTNHALNEEKLEKDITETWQWFAESAYWSKLNFMLGIMQVCDSQLLFIMGGQIKTLFQVERRKKKAVDEGIIEEDEHEYMSLCSSMTTSELSVIRSESELDTSPVDSEYWASLQSDAAQDSLDQQDLFSSKTLSRKDYLGRKSPGSETRSVPCHTTPDHPGKRPSRHIHSAPPQSKYRASKAPAKKSSSNKDDVSEDYMSGNDDDDDRFTTDPSVFVVSVPSVSYSGISRHKDFVRCLPVHLSKCILGLLDKNSLTNCLCISRHWRILAEEVRSDFMVHQLMLEEIMLMQGASAQGMDPHYAKFIAVHVPVEQDTDVEEQKKLAPKRYNRRRNLADCYVGIQTKLVRMEERNIYCGAYNVLVLQDVEDHHRCTNFTGGRFVVSGSYDRRVRLIDSATGKCERAIQGHAGSIRCVFVAEELGVVLSGGYDTSIRCWDINRGDCKCIFRGHRKTVTCISLHGNHLASGSRDKSVKVWNFASGKCRRTFRHRRMVLDVQVSDSIVVSGCEGGKVKVWDITSASLLKSLDGHHGAITCVKFDAYHIVTGSMDGYAMAWSAIGRHKKCLQAFRHPKEVICIEFLLCRVITGSADGKLRIWNLLNGDCLRLIRGNSKNDAITTICARDNRMVINTLSNLLIFNFEPVAWDYTLPPERPEGLGRLSTYGKHSPRKLPRHYVRAQRLMRADTKDSLASRPPSRTAILGVVGSGQVHEDPSKRISSAPARVKHRGSTLTSINSHVSRIVSARRTKPKRPQSSPAKVSFSQNIDKYNAPPFATNDSIRGKAFFTQVLQTYPRPPALPDNRSAHVISRGRSAPVFRTQTLPANKRGWTTSAEEAAKPCENKIMISPTQSKQSLTNQRPKSAHVNFKESISTNPLKSLSCLNLKTYSTQVEFEKHLKSMSGKCNSVKNAKHRTRSVSAGHGRRPYVPFT